MSQPRKIESLINDAMEKHPLMDSLCSIEKLPAFRKVVAHFLELDPDGAQINTSNMLLSFNRLHMRIQMHQYGVAGVEYDKAWQETAKHWTEKRAQLVDLLRDTADLFDSGQCESDSRPTLVKYKKIDTEQGVDEVLWCGSGNLRRWAEIVATSPVEVVFPVASSQNDGLVMPWAIIGERGKASDLDSAFRGMMVREIARYVPKTIGKYRPSIIAALARFLGMDIKVKPKYVRSLLLKGRTGNQARPVKVPAFRKLPLNSKK